MEEKFYDYLDDLYGDYVQYKLKKDFVILSSTYSSYELYIWEYNNTVMISDKEDYLNKVKENELTTGNVPQLIYIAYDNEKIMKLLKSVMESDYYKKIEGLMSLSRVEMVRTLEYN